MEFEVLKKDHKKKWVIGIVSILLIGSVVFFVSTRANYKKEQRLNIMNSTNNIEPVAVKLSSDGETYTSSDTVPTSGYTLNTEKNTFTCFSFVLILLYLILNLQN